MSNKIITVALLYACIHIFTNPCQANGENKTPVAFGGGMYCRDFLSVERRDNHLEKDLMEAYNLGYISGMITSMNIVSNNYNKSTGFVGRTLEFDKEKFRSFILAETKAKCEEDEGDQLITVTMKIYQDMMNKKL